MAADLIKYPQEAHILFVVYDYHHAIGDRERLSETLRAGDAVLCVSSLNWPKLKAFRDS